MATNIIGYYTTHEVVCPECFWYWVDKLTSENDNYALVELINGSEPTTFEALPDGFTCADCGKVVTL
jgi:rubredoxin